MSTGVLMRVGFTNIRNRVDAGRNTSRVRTLCFVNFGEIEALIVRGRVETHGAGAWRVKLCELPGGITLSAAE